MKKLSGRLGRVIDILEADGDEHNVTEVIFEGFKLALDVEAAPTVKVRGKVGEVCMVPISHDFCGKRVRILPEREG